MNQIVIRPDDSEPSRQAICDWLRAFNYERNGDYMRSLDQGARASFTLLASIDQVPVGGIIGTVDHHWIRIDLMAVAPEHRGNNFGRSLIECAESYGRERGCRFAYVDTMSYQATGFYLACGFDEVGRLVDWDSHGHDKIFLTKPLDERPV